MSSSTGSPQGCVLSPLLYIVCTEAASMKTDILKIADVVLLSVIVSLLHADENDRGPVVGDVVLESIHATKCGKDKGHAH